MQIPLNVLLYQLAASSIYESLNIDLSESFNGLKLFDIHTMLSLSDDTQKELYLVTAESLQESTDQIRVYNFNKVCAFLCICNNEDIHISDFDSSLSLILLYTKHTFAEIFNKALSIFYNFDIWDKHFHLSLLRGGSMQELLDLSSNILKHPMVVLDSNFSLLGQFRADLIDDPLMSGIIESGYVTPEIMTRLRQDGLISPSETAENPLINYYCITPQDCYYSMMYRFKANNHTVGYALIFRNKVHPKTNYLYLMNMVAENLELYFQQQRYTTRASSEIYESIFTDILDNPTASRRQVEDQLTFANGLSMEGRFMLARLSYTKPSELPYSFISWNLRNSFPALKPFVHNNTLYIVKICTEKDSISAFLTPDEETQFRKNFKGQNFFCAVSNMFFSLMELPLAAKQCETVFSEKGDSVDCFSYFGDISLKYILHELQKTSSLTMIESPLYQVLKQYDQVHNSDLCDIFIQYLKNGRNINQTSAAVFLHRNTVLNKIKKAISIMQSDCEDYQEQTTFILSYLADHD